MRCLQLPLQSTFIEVEIFETMVFVASGTFSTALHYRSKILGPTSLLLNMTQCSFAETPLLYMSRLGPEQKPNPGNTIIVLWVLDKSNWMLPPDVRLGFD